MIGAKLALGASNLVQLREPGPFATKSSRRASSLPAARARLSEQKLANRRPSTVTM
jgi:hypothetical protein